MSAKPDQRLVVIKVLGVGQRPGAEGHIGNDLVIGKPRHDMRHKAGRQDDDGNNGGAALVGCRPISGYKIGSHEKDGDE